MNCMCHFNHWGPVTSPAMPGWGRSGCRQRGLKIADGLLWVGCGAAVILILCRIQNTEYRILYCHFDHTCHVSKGTTGNKVHNYIQHIRRLKTSYTCIVQIRTMWLRLLKKKKQKNDLEHIIDIWKVIQWYYTYKTLTRSKYIQLINMCYHCNRSGFTQVGSWGQTLLHIEIC